MIIIGIFISILMFSLIILFHEYGHFKSARIFGVRVEEFGLGIPPRAKKLFKDKKGTLYSLNWLPIGGFVKLTGEQIYKFDIYDKENKLISNENIEDLLKNGEEIYDNEGNKLDDNEKKEILEKIKENKASYNLMNKPVWQQSIIILAGVFMNFVLAAIIFSILFFVGVKPVGINDRIQTNMDIKMFPTYEKAIESGFVERIDGVILFPLTGSIAEKSGIIQGDVLTKIVIDSSDFVSFDSTEIIKLISSNEANEVKFFIKCNVFDDKTDCENGNEKELKLTVGDDGKIGAGLMDNIFIDENFKYKYGFLDSIKYGTLETYYQSILTFKAIGLLFKNIFNPEKPQDREEAIKEMKGPIGIVVLINKSLEYGFVFIIIIGAILSINLGVFNLLPIPALDGGRFLFIMINFILKKVFKMKNATENIEPFIHIIFFIILIALSLIIAYNDINNIINN